MTVSPETFAGTTGREVLFLLDLLNQEGIIQELVGASLGVEPSPREAEMIDQHTSSCSHHLSLGIQPCLNF